MGAVLLEMPDDAALAALKASGKDEAAAAERLAAYHAANGPMVAELERRGILTRVPHADTALVCTAVEGLQAAPRPDPSSSAPRPVTAVAPVMDADPRRPVTAA